MKDPKGSFMESPKQSSNPVNNLLEEIFSYQGNIFLAAIISLLLVLLFVLLLHVYAKWFLAQARQRRSVVSVSHVLGPTRFHHSNAFTVDTTLSTSLSKGLEASVIASIPLFLYESDNHKHGLDCVICLSSFEELELGRKLPKCGHAFHVECIDMWLNSHSSCPICRSPVVMESEVEVVEIVSAEELSGLMNEEDSALEVVVEVPNSDNENENENGIVVMSDSLSPCSSSTYSLSSQVVSMGESVKRMLSRNRSDRKIHQSFDVSQ